MAQPRRRSTTSWSNDASSQVWASQRPGAFGSDHELVVMTLRLRLQKMKNQGNVRIRFSLEKRKDPYIAEFFRATIGGTFAPLLVLDNQDTEIHALINSFNTAVTETANNILGKHRPAKKPWVTDNILKLCDKCRELKQKKNAAEGANLYREANQQDKKGMRKLKDTCVKEQCQGIEENLQKTNTGKSYQLVKGLTSSKQGRTITIQDKAGKCLSRTWNRSWKKEEISTGCGGMLLPSSSPPPSPRKFWKSRLYSGQFEAFWRQIWRNSAH